MCEVKRRKVDLNDECVLKCLELIDNDHADALYVVLTPELLTKAVYPTGVESSKTRLIFYAIKNNKIDCVTTFLKFGLDVDLEYTDNEPDKKEFSSRSPVHYCIEGHHSIKILQKLLSWMDKPITKSHIMSALLANNGPALRQLFQTVSKFVLFIQDQPIQISEILKCYAEHPEIEIVETLEVVFTFMAATAGMFRAYRFYEIDNQLTLIYLASKRTNCSLKEAMDMVNICRYFHCNLDAMQGNDVPIHVALDYNNRNFVKALVEHGANIKRINKRGKTVLYEAFLKNDQDLIEFLLQKGANSQQENMFSSEEARNCVHMYSLHGKVVMSDSCVLYAAIKMLDVDLVCKIIQLDKHLNVSGDKSKMSFPILFFILGYLVVHEMTNVSTEFLMKITTVCIEMGFDVNTQCLRNQLINEMNFKGHTILHLAIRFFSTDFCRALVNIDADPCLISNYNQCAYALTMDYVLGLGFGVVEGPDILITKKFIFLNECKIDLQKNLPIPYEENPNICRFKNFCGHQNISPVQIILKSRNDHVFVLSRKWLVTPGKLGIQDLELAMKTRSFNVTFFILKNMAPNLNLTTLNTSNVKYLFKEKSHQKPLTFTKGCLARKVFETLCSKGFDINSLDEYGNSLFHYAARSQKFSGEESIELFFQMIYSLGGANSVDILNKMMQSPLYWALAVKRASAKNCKLHFCRGGMSSDRAALKTAMVKVFLRHGAEFRRKTRQGFSGIHLAINSGVTANVKQLIDKSGPEKDIVNSWRKMPSTKLPPYEDRESGNVEEVTWPYSALDMYYIVTPLTVAILNGDKEMIKLLLENGAILGKKDIHNSLYANNLTDFSIANFLFEYLAKDYSLEGDFLFDDVEKPTLEFIFDKLIRDITTNNNKAAYDIHALMTFTTNYISRKYDINVKPKKFPPLLYSFMQLALRGAGLPNANIQLFNYLMEHSDCDFVTFNNNNDRGGSILTFLLWCFGSLCLCVKKCAFDFQSDKNLFKPCFRRRILAQREYFIRMLLQRCPPSKWTACHFTKYIYHKEDDDILNRILLTGARDNLIREWPQIQTCRFGSEIYVVEQFIGLENFQVKVSRQQGPLNLAENSVMNINKFSEDVRGELLSVEFPEKIKKLVHFLDVEADEDLSLEIFAHDYN